MSSQQPLPDNTHLRTVLIAGAGNIGAALAPMVARMEEVARILLVDPDVYERKNLSCQDIYSCDVGRRKALVQARRLQRINPAIDVWAYCCSRGGPATWRVAGRCNSDLCGFQSVAAAT